MFFIYLQDNDLELAFVEPRTAQMFAAAGCEHMKKYGTNINHFAKIAYKNHLHSKNNPYAQTQLAISLDGIHQSTQVRDFLTILQCCRFSAGAAACIVANEEFVKSHGLESQSVEIVGMEMATDLPTTVQVIKHLLLLSNSLLMAYIFILGI